MEMTRRALVAAAGAALVCLTGCGNAENKPAGSSAPAKQPKETKNEKKASAEDIVFTMDTAYNQAVPTSDNSFTPFVTFMTKIKNTSDQVARRVVLEGIAKRADGTLAGSVERVCYCCLNPNEEGWVVGVIGNCDEVPASLEFTVKAEFEKPSEKASYQFEVLNENFDELMMHLQVEIVNNSEYNYEAPTFLFVVMKDAEGNVVNGMRGSQWEIEAGAHLILENNQIFGFGDEGKPYASYEYSISKGI